MSDFYSSESGSSTVLSPAFDPEVGQETTSPQDRRGAGKDLRGHLISRIDPQPGDLLIDGRILVQPRMGLIITAAGAQPVERKAMRLLQYLAKRSGEVATRGELFAAIWPDASVTGHSLNRLISGLRKAIGDDANTPELLVTIRGVGYRLQGSVISDLSSKAPVSSAARDLTPPRQTVSTIRSWVSCLRSRGRAFGCAAQAVAVRLLVPGTLLFWVLTTHSGSEQPSVRLSPSRHPQLDLLDSTLAAFDLARVRLSGATASHQSWDDLDFALETVDELIRIGRPSEAEVLLDDLGSSDRLVDVAEPVFDVEERTRRSALHRQRAKILYSKGQVDRGMRQAESALRWLALPRTTLEARAWVLAAIVKGEIAAEVGEANGLRILEDSFEMAKQTFGNGSELAIKSLCSLGAGYFFQRQLLEAEVYIGQCGVSTARLFGFDSLEYVSYQKLSAALQRARGAGQVATSQVQSALSRAEHILGSLESDLAIGLLVDKGTCLRLNGDLSASEKGLRQALELTDQILVKGFRRRNEILQNLGTTLLRAGRLAEAEAIQRRNLLALKRLGSGPIDLATAYQSLAATLRERGRPEQALAYSESALEILVERFGQQNLLVANSQMEVARNLVAVDRSRQAILLLTQAVATLDRSLSDDSLLSRESKDLLDFALARQGRKET